MGFFVFINLFALRVNLSVAIIEMVNSTYLRELEVAAANVSNNSLSSLFAEHDLRTTDDNNTHTYDDDGNVRTVYTDQRMKDIPVRFKIHLYLSFHVNFRSFPSPPLPLHFHPFPPSISLLCKI